MRRMYISSLYRLAELDERRGGELGRVYVLDWDTKKLLNNPYGLETGPTLNHPRGQSHGARGITVCGGFLYVASSNDKISKFDPDSMELVNVIRYPEFEGLHQIKSHKGKIYVASTANDKRFVI
ncbi:MAG: hypothetical protein KAS32_21345, partial [Candidatus Peribacteraceae bacterium]|nr:hypothetical protein [Candidatus Peribacteraceae bacterium]